MIVTDALAVTTPARTVNEADVSPVATVTDGGTVAELELEDRTTTAPGVAAGAERVSVPWIAPPPVTEFAERLTP